MRRNIFNNTTIVLLLLLLTLNKVEAFGRPRSHKNNRKSVRTRNDCDSGALPITPNSWTDNKEAADGPTTIDNDPYGNCALVGFGVVQKIPYRSAAAYSGSNPIDVNFSSACVRCGLCLAVVERINQTLVEAHDLMRSNQWLGDAETDLFLRTICDNEFRHYTLREIDGERYIGDSLPGATIVASNADGQWETNLINKCRDILDEVGTQRLYKYWKEWCNGAAIDFSEILCRSDSGTLRDCRSIEGNAKKPEDLCQSFYQAGIKVAAELSCS